MPERPFTFRHLVAAFAFMALGFMACLFAPIRPSLAPETASLVTRLHQATLDRLRADSGLAAFRATRSRDSARVEALSASQASYRASAGRLASQNAELLARLAQHPESTATIVPLLGRGIALQNQSCEAGLSACDSAKAVLRAQVASVDSAFGAERGRSAVNFALASDATGSAVRWNALADAYRRQRNMSLVLNGLLALLAALK